MWLTSDNTVLNIEATVPDQTYLGIMFGKSMKDSDVIIMQANGSSSTYADYWASGYMAPTKDTVQNVSCTNTVSGTDVIYSCTRPLNTEETTQDKVLSLDAQFDISYAINTNTSNLQFHNRNGHEVVTLDSSSSEALWGVQSSSATSIAAAAITLTVMSVLAF
mmetsp:Transcript_1474/g.976  ORF Transcript_1474/g.976 Transcript_1474/m.976 type:complete len:163 (-) Transcript_1474:104-592(-)